MRDVESWFMEIYDIFAKSFTLMAALYQQDCKFNLAGDLKQHGLLIFMPTFCDLFAESSVWGYLKYFIDSANKSRNVESGLYAERRGWALCGT